MHILVKMYINDYNNKIVEQIKGNNKRQTRRQEEAATVGRSSFTPHLEGMALRDASIVGSSSHARRQHVETKASQKIIHSEL